MKKIKRLISILIILIITILIVLVSYYIYLRINNIVSVKNAKIIKKDYQEFSFSDKKKTLNVITFNIGFASGSMQTTLFDAHKKIFFINNLDKLVEFIQKTDTDIVLIQEVDIAATRSHYINQLDYLLEKLQWNYAALVHDWKKYIPFVGIKDMNKGAAIISKYPITKHEYKNFLFSPIFKNEIKNFVYYLISWYSPAQYVQVKIKNKKINIFNTHTSVWKRPYRVKMLNAILQWIEENSLEKNIIIGGDFNYHGFLRPVGINEPNDKLPPYFNILWEKIDGIQEAMITKNTSINEIHKNITFKENRSRYDFIFFTKEFKKIHAFVNNKIDISDHQPVFLSLELIQ